MAEFSGPVIVLLDLLGDGRVDTAGWASAELFPSRGFALGLLGERHRQEGTRASYCLWWLEEVPADPRGVRGLLGVHPHERVTCSGGGQIELVGYSPPLPAAAEDRP